MSYQRLTYELRCQIYALKSIGMLQNDMASLLMVAASTISRELRRNSGKRGYRDKWAHLKAKERRAAASSGAKKMTAERVLLIESKLKKNGVLNRSRVS